MRVLYCSTMKAEVRVSKKLNCHFVAKTCRSWQIEVKNGEESLVGSSHCM